MELTEQLQPAQFFAGSLMESHIDALMTADPIGIISSVNNQMVALSGYTRDELIGAPFNSCFTDPQLAEECFKLVLREGKVTEYELTMRSKSGKMTVVSFSASTFRDAGGKLRGVFAVARDITEQKGLEQRLRESEAYNRGLIDASSDGLITVDPMGTITDVNDLICQMSGYSRDELVGTRFRDYFASGERVDSGVKHFDKGMFTDCPLIMSTRSGRPLGILFKGVIGGQACKHSLIIISFAHSTAVKDTSHI